MNPTSISERNHHILFDSDAISQIVPQWFTSEYWQDKAHVVSVSRGRGRAWFIENDKLAMVLRHYQRGGAMARLLGDRYFWHGLENTRAWREWRLLASLRQQELPVPRPLAVHVWHTGVFYRADLITERINNSLSLSDTLAKQALDETTWRRIGKVIRQFHAANVYHADMNAHNILLESKQNIYLIDFDKCRLMPADQQKTTWQESTLQRLQRSLNKLRFEDIRFNYADSNWALFMDGYQNG